MTVGARSRATGRARFKACFRVLQSDFGAYRAVLVIFLRRATPVARERAPTVVPATVYFDSFIQTFVLSSDTLMSSQMYRGTKKALDDYSERFVSDKKLHYECAGR